jgi:hypothetical protein
MNAYAPGLATITPASLPPQVYAHTVNHDPRITADPARFPSPSWSAVTRTGRRWPPPAGTRCT